VRVLRDLRCVNSTAHPGRLSEHFRGILPRSMTTENSRCAQNSEPEELFLELALYSFRNSGSDTNDVRSQTPISGWASSRFVGRPFSRRAPIRSLIPSYLNPAAELVHYGAVGLAISGLIPTSLQNASQAHSTNREATKTCPVMRPANGYRVLDNRPDDRDPSLDVALGVLRGRVPPRTGYREHWLERL
jgi:hypothetical protein